jgi:hypothetical protein
VKWKFITTKSTTKGTIATLLDNGIYDINLEAGNGQNDEPVTDEQRTGNGQVTTNKNVKKQKNANNEKKTIFPIALDNPTFLAVWKEWVQFRAEIKKKLTPTTISKQLRMLENHGSPVAIGIINRSIQNGWQGLFPPEKTDSIPVVPRKDVQIAQWENQCGGWLRQSSKETIANHGSFMQRLKNPEFRKWAESVNVIVKEIQCNQ